MELWLSLYWGSPLGLGGFFAGLGVFFAGLGALTWASAYARDKKQPK